MSKRSRQYARIARARAIQHNLAATASQRAFGHVESLETTAERLASLRDSFSAAPGGLSGATLASLGEMAQRLDKARTDMGKSIAAARAKAAACNEARLAARRNQESADRLTERAAVDAMRAAERKQGQLRPLRRRFLDPESHS